MATPSPFTYPNRKCGGRQQWCHTRDQVLHLSLYTDQWCNHLHEILKTNIADNQKLNKPCNLIDPLPTFNSSTLILKKPHNNTEESSIVVPLGVYWKYWPGPGSTYFEWCGKFVHLLRLFREHWGVRLVERPAKNLEKNPQRFISFLQVTFYIIPVVIFWMFISLCLKNLNLLAFIDQLKISWAVLSNGKTSKHV